VPEPAAGVMRMSTDDDDQADQQHELVDPGMADSRQTIQCSKRHDRNFIVELLSEHVSGDENGAERAKNRLER